ncbi:MAG: serine/threonine protein kinase, partial [Candidatus Wallbacteria bacterium]|nr:serine/threonine protein kinase [Candidatus Wallbacteria bacterium]
MSVVYRATQLSLGREVALKVMSAALAGDREARQRFIYEGILAGRVTHPNLVKVVDVGEAGERLYLAYELVRGETLRVRLARARRFSLAASLEIVRACAEALAVLHAAGILHRDLKPENLFLDEQRGLLVGDLGIAKDLLGGGVNTRAGYII